MNKKKKRKCEKFYNGNSVSFDTTTKLRKLQKNEVTDNSTSKFLQLREQNIPICYIRTTLRFFKYLHQEIHVSIAIIGTYFSTMAAQLDMAENKLARIDRDAENKSSGCWSAAGTRRKSNPFSGVRRKLEFSR